MGREQTNPDYNDAVQKGLPEAYVPFDVLFSLLNNTEMEDDVSVLKLGSRISPSGIRTMLFTACNGFYTEDEGYMLPFDTFQKRTMALLYGYFNDFFTPEEFNQIARGQRIQGNLSQSEADLLVGPTHPALGNKIMPTIEEAALDIERKKKENPNLKVIFLHGKWNNVPHPGHIILTRDICNEINYQYGIDYKDMAVVVSCDRNSFIKASGAVPFLNTLWRASMMSYIPWVDYVCTSGDYDHKRLGKSSLDHFTHKYRVLRPDFVNVDGGSSKLEELKLRIKGVGAKPIVIPRLSEWLPTLGNPFGKRVDKPISATNIRSDKTDTFAMEREFNHLLTVKQIRDEMYGPRRLFVPSNLLTLDRARGLYPTFISQPSEVELPKVLVPDLPIPLNEILLRQALRSV